MKSVPIELLSLVNLLIDGLYMDNDHFSQATLTISQLLVSNFKKKSTGLESHQRNLRDRETPIQHTYP